MTSLRAAEHGELGHGESGAVLIHVALALFVLFGLTTFVLDYGVMWTSRGQAQNSADAGAMAGAVARAFDDTATPPAAGGRAYTAALLAAQANEVFGEAGGTVISWACPPWSSHTRCVRVDVHRDGTNGSTALPVYFARLFGTTTQRVQATATAAALPANATACLRPWSVPDIWNEQRTSAGVADPGGWTSTSTFDRYVAGGKNAGALLPTPPPLDSYTELGYRNSMVGTEVTLMFGTVSGPVENGWYLAVDIPRADGTGATGGARYRANIQSCNGIVTRIGQYLNTETGAKSGPTAQGVRDLIAQDPYATWNTSTNQIQNSCTSATPSCGPLSPRVVVVSVFDPDDFARRNATNDTSPCSGGGQCVKVVNMFGFFIEGVDNNGNVLGRLTQQQGEYIEGGWTVGDADAFLWAFQLIR